MILALALTLYLAAAAVVDLRTGRVPNWYTLSVTGAAGLSAILAGRWEFVAFWLPLYILWQLGLMGGGDAKVLMAFFAVYPTGAALVVLCAVLTVVLIPVTAWKHRHHWRTVGRDLQLRLLTRDWLPDPTALDRQGVGTTWAFALGGIVYVWLVATVP